MDGLLIYFKSKNKGVLHRCIIEIDQMNKLNSRFLLFNTDKKSIKREITFKSIIKISEYYDMSWELNTLSGNRYHFKAEDSEENAKWIDMIKAITNRSNSQIILANSLKNDSSSQRDDEFFRVQIIEQLTNPNFLNILSVKSVYTISFSEGSIILKNNSGAETYRFEARIIRKYGSFENCFVFELGKNLDYGPGLIALKSAKYNTKIYYDSLYEFMTKSIDLLSSKLTKMRERESNQDQTEYYDQPIIQNNNSNYPDMDRLNEEIDYDNRYDLMIVKDLNNNSMYRVNGNTQSYEKNTFVERTNPHDGIEQNLYVPKSVVIEKKLQQQISVESNETDENFYKDEYVPQYASNKHLKSPALEYFVEEDQSIYGRIKL